LWQKKEGEKGDPLANWSALPIVADEKKAWRMLERRNVSGKKKKSGTPDPYAVKMTPRQRET